MDVAGTLEFLFQKHGDRRKRIIEVCLLGEYSNGLLANIVDMYPDLEVLSLAGCVSLTSAA